MSYTPARESLLGRTVGGTQRNRSDSLWRGNVNEDLLQL